MSLLFPTKVFSTFWLIMSKWLVVGTCSLLYCTHTTFVNKGLFLRAPYLSHRNEFACQSLLPAEKWLCKVWIGILRGMWLPNMLYCITPTNWWCIVHIPTFPKLWAGLELQTIDFSFRQESKVMSCLISNRKKSSFTDKSHASLDKLHFICIQQTDNLFQ